MLPACVSGKIRLQPGGQPFFKDCDGGIRWGGTARVTESFLKAHLSKAGASSVSGQHDTFFLGHLRVTGPIISPAKSEEVVMWMALRCRQGSTFKGFWGGAVLSIHV